MIQIPEKYKEMFSDSTHVYMQNKTWKRFLENAPSETCKMMIRILYNNSLIEGSMKESELLKFAHSVRDAMTIEDWKYYRKIAVGTPLWAKCNKHIEELGGTP